MPTVAKRAPSGQAIRRATMLLRLVARHNALGSRISDISKAAGVSHGTVHRILQVLTEEGFIRQEVGTRRYKLGYLNFELGLATDSRPIFGGKLRPALEHISSVTSDTVYLTMQSGTESVCVDVVIGSSPIRTLTTEIGHRRPLCFGSSGWAMLAQMRDAEVESVLRANARDIANHRRLTNEKIRRGVARARATGFAFARDMSIVGVSSLAVALRPSGDRPMVSVSIGMINDRLPLSRRKELVDVLKSELGDEIMGLK